MTTEQKTKLRIKMITTAGSRYESGRDIKDVAKDVRRDIKAAVKAGELSTLKASVRIERYSMGQTLRIEITEIDCTVFNLDAHAKQEAAGYMLSWVDCGGQYSEDGRRVLDAITAIANQYQRVQSSNQPDDYHSVNFHLDVEFSHDLREAQLATKASDSEPKPEPEPAAIDFDYPVFDWTGSAI